MGLTSGLITDTITLSGVITDPGTVASGIQQLEIDLVPVGQISDTWHTTTLANSGAGVANSTWSYPIPSGIEGNYLINLRGTDIQGNQTSESDWFTNWQGEIDTLAPRVVMTATLLHNGRASKTLLEATITDRNLTEAGLAFPCAVQRTDRGYTSDPFLTNLGSGQQQLTTLHLACQVKGHLTDPISLHVFDQYGHETIATTTAVAASAFPFMSPLVSAPPMATQFASVNWLSPRLLPTFAPLPDLAGTVLTPTHESTITDISSPITIEGGAYGIAGLKALTLTINSAVAYTTTWVISPTVTDTTVANNLDTTR